MTDYLGDEPDDGEILQCHVCGCDVPATREWCDPGYELFAERTCDEHGEPVCEDCTCKPAVGRPRLCPEGVVTVSVSMTPGQRAALRAAAREGGKSLSAYLRDMWERSGSTRRSGSTESGS